MPTRRMPFPSSGFPMPASGFDPVICLVQRTRLLMGAPAPRPRLGERPPEARVVLRDAADRLVPEVVCAPARGSRR